ncbi:MAG: YihY/virulence factor BrkB family protein, partial [Lentisphaeria bacterium]|nr:YihY/virulence factor BrkB family protein [Lentisphaeria bacterium]
MFKKMRDFFVNAGKVLYVSSRKFFKNDHTLQATALTYYTLFAVVPILALLFGIAKGFSLDDKLKSIIAERFAEQQNIVQWMYKFADTTLRNADGGIIAGIGILVLFWTVIRLATYVENSFNQIWAVRKGRNFFRKVSDYLSIIIIAPILL